MQTAAAAMNINININAYQLPTSDDPWTALLYTGRLLDIYTVLFSASHAVVSCAIIARNFLCHNCRLSNVMENIHEGKKLQP